MAAFVPVALGIGNGIIPNDAMRASSVLDRYHVPSQARLNNAKQGKNGGAWKPKLNDKKQYLEVDLGATTKVTQVRVGLPYTHITFSVKCSGSTKKYIIFCMTSLVNFLWL